MSRGHGTTHVDPGIPESRVDGHFARTGNCDPETTWKVVLPCCKIDLSSARDRRSRFSSATSEGQCQQQQAKEAVQLKEPGEVDDQPPGHSGRGHGSSRARAHHITGKRWIVLSRYSFRNHHRGIRLFSEFWFGRRRTRFDGLGPIIGDPKPQHRCRSRRPRDRNLHRFRRLTSRFTRLIHRGPADINTPLPIDRNHPDIFGASLNRRPPRESDKVARTSLTSLVLDFAPTLTTLCSDHGHGSNRLEPRLRHRHA